MGKAFSVALRPFKNYNIQTKAHKFLDAEKPRAAPKHPSDRTWKEASERELDDIEKKDEGLVNNLKSVYVVTSPDAVPLSKSEEGASSNRPLPSYRNIVDRPFFGYVEPEHVSEGKVSLMRAITFIIEHQTNPEVVTSKVIASKHRLDEEMVKKILAHFSWPESWSGETEEEEPTITQRIAQLPRMLVPKSIKDSSERDS